MSLSRNDYIIIAIGLLTIPIVIGFFILGTMAWIIGSRMEKEQEKPWQKDFDKAMEQFSKDIENIDKDIDMAQVALSHDTPDLIDRKRFKLKSYSSKTLEDGK